ncbi:F-box/LRR-repeat protein At3g26922-like [Papaver somniferum]|uniref:F-box/LRR-repeat protein At3g26922-like n=1 Tax=Papaver somniferum TaxID=3469 RepID=UPI000E6FD9CF|nr:F-box/LRR-repeat protein At3g26922-like [Papaver somniferum]
MVPLFQEVSLFQNSRALGSVEFDLPGDCWNAQHFSNCPVLENLSLEDCSLSDMRNFCISIPTLKLLKVYTWDEDGLQDCAFKINAPNLVSLTYCGRVAKEYILSSFQTLESAEVLFCKYDALSIMDDWLLPLLASALEPGSAAAPALTAY